MEADPTPNMLYYIQNIRWWTNFNYKKRWCFSTTGILFLGEGSVLN